MEVQSQNTKPVTIAQFSDIMDRFKGFESNPHVAVAVSGGSDSMALAFLTHQWILKKSGRMTALIVDHGLRLESSKEASLVQEKLRHLGIEAHILKWHGEKPTTRIQERARQKRYELLEAWCHRHHVLHLLVAHHGDDQWETVMYRLSKGSDLKGLMGMRPEIHRAFGRILRPLLSFSKEDIKATLKEDGIAIEDPSNQNEKFTRVKWRHLYPSLASLELDRQRLCQSIERWQGTFQIYQKALNDVLVEGCFLDEYGCFHMSLDVLEKEDPILQSHVLKKIINCFAHRPYGVEMKTIDHMIDKLFHQGQRGVTGAGCYVLKRKRELLIMRELRAIPASTTIQENHLIWDQRFLLSFPDSYLSFEIKPLGEALAQQLGKDVQGHRQIVQTLPAVYDQEKFIGLAHHLAKTNPAIKVNCFTLTPLIN